MLIEHLYIFSGEMSVQVLCPFLNQVFVVVIVSFRSYLYILDINPLSMYDLQIFSSILWVAFLLC